MKFTYDHDLHIHSSVSPCGGDPAQTPGRILQYAADNGLKTICVTDHYWDDMVPHPYGKGAGQTARHSVPQGILLRRKSAFRKGKKRRKE